MPPISEIDEEIIRKKLAKSLTINWEQVVKIYQQHPQSHKIKITESGNTALHLAVSSGREEIVAKLVKLITENHHNLYNPVEVLSIKNSQENGPLHLAASLGNVVMCKCIVSCDEYKQLLGSRNKEGETPLFLAARHGRKTAFLLLYEMSDRGQVLGYCKNKSDETVLHCAIDGGYYDLAFEIVQREEDLVDVVDNDGLSPLHVLAQKPNAFRSSVYLSPFNKIIYDNIPVEDLIPGSCEQGKKSCFPVLWEMIDLPGKSNKQLDAENPEEGQGIIHGHHSSNRAQRYQQFPSESYGRCSRFIKLLISKPLLVIFSLMPGTVEIRKLREKKKMHLLSVLIMNKLLDHAKNSGDGTEGDRDYFPKGQKASQETPILLAAKNGILEMVDKILQDFPMAVFESDLNDRNILLLAVENRQSQVYSFLLKRIKILGEDRAFHAVGDYRYRALLGAASRDKTRSQLIPTSLLKMQWEVKWFEYVKKSLLPDFVEPRHKFFYTSEEIFLKKHRELEDESKQWLNDTSNSCSFVASLIATVAFASSATVPGGIDQDTGKPIFEHRLAFKVFAISSLVALCSSFISLLIFFTFLITKYQYKDFSYRLPKNLWLALTFLFISMAAMLTSFCSGHFLMLEGNLRYAAIPMYTITTFAITFLAFQQFPSYFILTKSMFQEVPFQIYLEYL